MIPLFGIFLAFGSTSGPIVIGDMEGISCAFLPRCVLDFNPHFKTMVLSEDVAKVFLELWRFFVGAFQSTCAGASEGEHLIEEIVSAFPNLCCVMFETVGVFLGLGEENTQKNGVLPQNKQLLPQIFETSFNVG